MVRAPCCEKMGLKKGPWTPAEDQVLIAYIQRYGHGNWRALPKQAGLLRCGKSCRLRWTNYLRPDIKRGNFSQEEEETIIKLHEMLGNRWSAIAARLPGRTDNEIKNVWHTYLKKRLKQNPAPETHRKPMETSEYNMNPKKESTLHNTEPQSPTTAHHRLENPSQLPVSPSQSSTDFPSSANTDSSFFTCETQITAATTTGEDEGSSESAGCFIDNWLENFAGIDDFFTDALPEENPSCIDVVKPPQQQMEFPCSPISSWPYSPYNDDSMDFWFNVLMEAGQVPVIEEF